MFKSNLIYKFTVVTIILIILSIFVSVLLQQDLFSIIVLSTTLLIFYLISVLFINKEVVRPLKIFNYFASETKSNEDNDESNNFEVKLAEIKKVNDLISDHLNKANYNSDIKFLFESLVMLSERLSNELNTAKVFKINRNEFLGNVAHELRTPIFAIQLSIETLIDGAINDEKVNLDFLNRALRQASRLKELVDDLITISKFETGLRMSKRYFDITEFSKIVINELKSLAENKKINLILENNLSEETQVFGDSERVKQVFVNLIDNAIKYTPESGKVKIVLTETEKHINIDIVDSGVGIPKKDIPRIFERFYRVDKNRSRDKGGSGLGLSIVKHILEVHNSTIKVESEENIGTKFSFNLQK
ncbi:MAG TPA: ATP-binding protein [Ignavibacteria bacterium]|nr:ATP-binding protein [Ignavibacteria bacterium]